MTSRVSILIKYLIPFCGLAVSAWSQGEMDPRPEVPQQASTASLSQKGLGVAKISRNPLTNNIIVPFQFNFNFGYGPRHDSTQFAPNAQPIIPFEITQNFNIITRTILPFISQPKPPLARGSVSSLGDLNFALYLSPVSPHHFVWGLGPAFLFPTATDRQLGTGKFNLGPSAIVAWISEQWLVAAFIQSVWSIAGASDRFSVRQLSIQLFSNYAIAREWYLTSVPLITANYTAPDGNKWIVPVGGGFGHVIRFGQQPIDFTAQAFYNIISPNAGADWQLRLTATLIFPKKHDNR